jgi:PatG Domain
MERQEVNENTVTGTVGAAAVAAASQAATSSNAAALSGLKEASLAVAPAKSGVSPMQAIPPACPTCGGAVVEGATRMTSHIYALGQIEARFPRPSVEREMAQATGRAETAGRTDQQAFYEVLHRRENRYLARQMCWVLMVQGLETYIVLPRDPSDLDLLISAIEPHESPWISTVIGLRGPIAPPDYCNGLMVPMVIFDQVYTFSRHALIEAIPKPEEMSAHEFGAASRELFDRIMQMTDNAGATDEHRALNYLSVRYPAIYARAAEEFARDFSLTSVEVRPSPLSATRNIVEVIFAYTNRNTDFTEKCFVRVDVTEAFPFLVTKLSHYYDR